jgi:hypothetical protein
LEERREVMNLSDLQEKQIPVQIAGPVIDLHSAVHEALKSELAGWQITQIMAESVTTYEPVLATRQHPHPVYILLYRSVFFEIICVEDGPLEKVEHGVTITLPVKRLHLNAIMIGNDNLIITDAKIKI